MPHGGTYTLLLLCAEQGNPELKDSGSKLMIPGVLQDTQVLHRDSPYCSSQSYLLYLSGSHLEDGIMLGFVQMQERNRTNHLLLSINTSPYSLVVSWKNTECIEHSMNRNFSFNLNLESISAKSDPAVMSQ